MMLIDAKIILKDATVEAFRKVIGNDEYQALIREWTAKVYAREYRMVIYDKCWTYGFSEHCQKWTITETGLLPLGYEINGISQ